MARLGHVLTSTLFLIVHYMYADAYVIEDRTVQTEPRAVQEAISSRPLCK